MSSAFVDTIFTKENGCHLLVKNWCANKKAEIEATRTQWQCESQNPPWNRHKSLTMCHERFLLEVILIWRFKSNPPNR